MRRQKNDTESLVYAYGCGQPLAGWLEAQAEQERIEILWDQLVQIERRYDDEILVAAARDVPQVRALVEALEVLRDEIGRAEKPARAPLVGERHAAQRDLWAALAVWRKAHPDLLRIIELRRRARVVEARQSCSYDALMELKRVREALQEKKRPEILRRISELDAEITKREQIVLYWANSNAVIARYETQRIEVRKKGRRLRSRDLERDDGCLTVQIQRTRSGLGAAPAELQDGTVGALQIGVVDPRAYDPRAASRGQRDRMCRTTVELRVDAAGNTLRLPVWMHRPLPAESRVKSAQIVWRRQGDRLIYQLCLTLSRPAVARPPRVGPAVSVRIDIADAGNALQVATADDGGMPDRLCLDAHWLAMMDRVDHLAAVMADTQATEHARIRARLERPGLHARLLRRRREIYRLWARALSLRYGRIIVETPALSEQAWSDRGTAGNVLRHRACAHALVAELQHQGKKHGCAVEIVIATADASAPVPRRVSRRRIKALPGGNAAQSAALANAEASP